MVRTTIVKYEYIPSEYITARGTLRELKRKYPEYKIKIGKNDYCILTKNPKFEITLYWDNIRLETFDMRNDILDLYDRKYATERLLETFIKDVEEGKYEIWMDSYRGYVIR